MFTQENGLNTTSTQPQPQPSTRQTTDPSSLQDELLDMVYVNRNNRQRSETNAIRSFILNSLTTNLDQLNQLTSLNPTIQAHIQSIQQNSTPLNSHFHPSPVTLLHTPLTQSNTQNIPLPFNLAQQERGTSRRPRPFQRIQTTTNARRGTPSNPSIHPQFRAKTVCLLFCKHCQTELCKRGMKAILLGNTKVELFSTDTPPVGVQLVYDDYMTHNCCCRIKDAACLGCGNVVGYHVTGPCETCLEACNNGHFWMFHSEGVGSIDRLDKTGVSILKWAALGVSDEPDSESSCNSVMARHSLCR